MDRQDFHHPCPIIFLSMFRIVYENIAEPVDDFVCKVLDILNNSNNCNDLVVVYVRMMQMLNQDDLLGSNEHLINSNLVMMLVSQLRLMFVQRIDLTYVFLVAVVVDDDDVVEEEVDVVGIEDHALLKLIDWSYYLKMVVAMVARMMKHKLNL